MKNIISILKNKSNLMFIIIAILFSIYFSYQIINPILEKTIKSDNSFDSFDKISEYLK